MSFDFNNAALFAYMARRRDIEDTNNIMITAGLAKGDALSKTLIPLTVVNQADELAQKTREIATLRKTQQVNTTNTDGRPVLSSGDHNSTNGTGNGTSTAATNDPVPVERSLATLTEGLAALTKAVTEQVAVQKQMMELINKRSDTPTPTPPTQ